MKLSWREGAWTQDNRIEKIEDACGSTEIAYEEKRRCSAQTLDEMPEEKDWTW
jgi:hypothetical protein